MILKTQLLLLFFSANYFLGTSISNLFYKALYSESLEKIETTLEAIEKEKIDSDVNAYRGGLLMKKSGFMKTAAKKIEVFKAGHKLLEKAIKENPRNVEYRFIRLTIQEKAPKILKYNKQIEEDKALIIKGYQKMSKAMRAYVLDYAQQSVVLSTEDLQ